MPYYIIKGDITKVKADAIVNAANNSLLGGGGVDGAIHRAAGKQLFEECLTLGGCETGSAKVTKGYNLPCRYVIHTVGPIWCGGANGEEALLRSCYTRSLELARENGCKTVAFPLISAGVYGYPKAEALRVAAEAISDFLAADDSDMTVTLVLFDSNVVSEITSRFADIDSYISEACGEVDFCSEMPAPCGVSAKESAKKSLFGRKSAESNEMDEAVSMALCAAPEALEDMLKNLDCSFSEKLMRLIDERGLKDPEVYKRANIDRKLFSKIRSDKNYRPRKNTVLAFAVALQLTPAETDELLKCAGYALSHSQKTDVIVEYFLGKRIYNIYEINEVLFAYDQALIGG